MGNAMKTKILTTVVFALATGIASGAHAADAWLACMGSATVLPKGAKVATSTEPSSRVIVVNDDAKRIYQWMENKKQLSPLPEKTYTATQVTWEVDMLRTDGSTWTGKLDREKLTLGIDYYDRHLTHTAWREDCKPTGPLDKSEPAVAGAEVPQPTTRVN